MKKWTALIRYYFKVDADNLDDDKFWQLVGELQWCLKKFGNLDG